MKNLLYILLIIFTSTAVNAQSLKFQRVCNGGNNNTLTWQLVNNGCTQISQITIHAKDAASQPFTPIATSIDPNIKTYTHVNSNVPSVKPWEYVLEISLYCGGPDTISFFSDTLMIDDVKPDSTILDSISVDPVTGVVYMGWKPNKTPDFSSYYLYNYDRADPRLIENYKDTFYIDNSPINPRLKSLTYDITSADSCDNRKDYGNYKHQTIWLRASVDSCSKSSNLTWSNYVGWLTDSIEIYRGTSTTLFEKIGSVPSGVASFFDPLIPNNTNISYFIRAYKLNGGSSSSSNSTAPANSGKSINPNNTEIEHVSVIDNGKIEIKINRNPGSNYSNIDLVKTSGANESTIYSFDPFTNQYIDLTDDTKSYTYRLLAKNVCLLPVDTSMLSNNIVLELTPLNTGELSMDWTRYFTWNTGVKDYTIYRSSGINMTTLSSFTVIKSGVVDSNYMDQNLVDPINCYYVMANSNNGTSQSKSNVSCYIKSGSVYYPNALTRFGQNSRFIFVGEGIDLSQSSIQIFNRWGLIEYSKNDISTGWDGKNNLGENVPVGVYFFTAQVKVGNETININGNITVLQ